MTTLDFFKKLNDTQFKTNIITTLFHSYISEFNENSLDNASIIKFIENLPDEKFSEFGAKLGRCLSYCKEEIDNANSLDNNTYVTKIKKIETTLNQTSLLYNQVSNNKYKKTDNVSSTIAQHEDSLKEIKEKIKILNTSVKDANDLIDNKIFSLLINTVAILGIFVAIAFTGFGVMSIFSNINIEAALASQEAFIKNIFFLLLVTLVSYNLLFLLTFFIYKLSRPVMCFIKHSNNFIKERYITSLRMLPFILIDIIIFVLTIVALIFSILFA